MLTGNYRSLLVWLAIILTGSFVSASYAANLGGKYSLDLSNFIVFENGKFKRQYLSTHFIPEITLGEETAGSSRTPAPESETICLVTGTYSISTSSIQLDYENDSCGMQEGSVTAFFDANAEAITIEGETYKRSTGAIGISSRESSITEVPDQEGVTSEAPASEPGGAEEIAPSSEATPQIEASFEVWQSNTAQAMEDLNNNSGGMWYCSSGRPRLNAQYWTWTSSIGSGGWIPNSQVKPSEAINWYFGQISNDEACTECLMAARASFYKGLLETIGVDAFDQWFENHRSDLVISNNSYAPSPLRVNKPVSSESDLSRGDWVYFQNWVTYNGCPDINLMQGENAITQSSGEPKTFIGLGIPGRGGAPILGQTILDQLRSAWQGTSCPQEREGQLRTDMVATSSGAYFEQVMNATTGTPPHGLDGITIDGAFDDWANITPLTDSVFDGGVIDWDNVWFHEDDKFLSFSYDEANQFQGVNYESEPYYWQIFLDSDNQTSTGYPFGLVSADYLIAGKNLYRYTGNGRSWSWSYMEDVRHAFNGSRVELAVNKSALGLSSEAASHRALFWGQHPNDNRGDSLIISVDANGNGSVLER